MTTSRFFAEFLERAPMNFRDKTVQKYDECFKSFLAISGDKLLRFVGPMDIERYKQTRAKKVSPTTVNIDLRTVRAAFEEAVRLKLIPENPFDGVRFLRVPDEEAPYLSIAEFHHLIQSIDDIELRDIITFAVQTMMRRGEIVNLKPEQLDFARRVIQVRSSGKFRVKGGKPRAIRMSPWVYEFLKSKMLEGEYVFTSVKGGPYTGNWLSCRFRRAVRKANLPKGIHFHSLRHTGISYLVNWGIAPQFIQKLAGHSSLAVTQRYSHVDDRNLVVAVGAFDRLNAT
jgi:integrase